MLLQYRGKKVCSRPVILQFLYIEWGSRRQYIEPIILEKLDQLYYSIMNTDVVRRSRGKKENIFTGRHQLYYIIYILGYRTIYRRGENM